MGLATRDAPYAGNRNQISGGTRACHPSLAGQSIAKPPVDGTGGSSNFKGNDMPPVAEAAFQRGKWLAMGKAKA